MSERPLPRQYFTARQGRGPQARPLTLDNLKRLVGDVWDGLSNDGFMQEALGYWCVDATPNDVPGYLSDPEAYLFRALHRDNVWPWGTRIAEWDEDTLFDMIEAVHDLSSEPTNGYHHTFANCGWHFSEFNRDAGRARYRTEMNDVLDRWNPPYEMNEGGEIVLAAPAEFDPLLSAPLPEHVHEHAVRLKVESAVERFRSRGSNMEERRVAVRDLADVLEALKPEMEKSQLTTKDESALFNIANNFALRHNNEKQHRDYDVNWLTWIFYFYLATIHALVRVSQGDATAA